MTENRHDAIGRRTFIKKSGAGILGLTALDHRLLGSGFAPTGVGANDRIVLGMIGVGSMGKSRLRGFLEHPDVEIAAICDVDAKHVEEAIALVRESGQRTPRAYRDFR